MEADDAVTDDAVAEDLEADEIHPQAAVAVRRQDRVPLPHNRYALKLLRPVSRLVSRVENRDAPEVGRTIDGTVPGADGDLDARLYLPDTDRPVPTVVFFHGGGFVLGNVETHDRLCRRLTRESGCGVLSVEYRLAPEHPFPAAVEDAYAVTEWAATNPEDLGGDGSVAIAGDSAGGTLAAVVSLMSAERDGPTIAHQALVYPAVGVEEDHPSVRNHAGVVLSEADLRWFRDCYYGSEVHQRNPYADPMNAADLSGVAPATVVTAGFDPLRDGGRAYAERLDKAGVPTRYENYEDMVHGFATMAGVDRAREVAADLGAALAAAFEDGEAPDEASEQ